jgi:DNA invertase Pin-like site-specific DNA recombinase
MIDEKEPDILELILSACKAEGVDPAVASMIENRVREQCGGRRVYVQKRRKHPSEHERQAVFNEGLSNKPTQEIIEQRGISRSTLYRLMKRGK